MRGRRSSQLASILLIAVLVLLALFHLLRTFSDNDFFWHLKTGEWIAQHRALPEHDPFAYTTQELDTPRSRFILRGFWLGQLLYHGVYRLGGFDGLALLRVPLVALLAVLLWRRREGDPLYDLALLVLALLALLGMYPLDRPQVFSFLFFAALLLLLERIRAGRAGPWTVAAIPLAMLAWANLHPGYALGVAVIALYLAAEGFRLLVPALRPIGRDRYRQLLLAGVLGVAASLLNPSGYRALVEVVSPKPDAAFNTEYISAIEALTVFNDTRVLVYLLFVALAAWALVSSWRERRFDLTQALLLTGLGVLSFTGIRYIAFFLVAALPVVGSRTPGGKAAGAWKWATVALALGLGLYATWGERDNLRRVGTGGWVHRYHFPVDAAEFIAGSELPGRMYNYWPWGGYLIWRLGPERQVFFDGRHLSYELFDQARAIDSAAPAAPGAPPRWKADLERYGVRWVVGPFADSDGTVIPLVFGLLQDANWVPIYSDYRAGIYVRRAPDTTELLRRRAIPRADFVAGLISTCREFIAADPRNPFPYITLGDLYRAQGRPAEAAQSYSRALEIAPWNATARRLLEGLR